MYHNSIHSLWQADSLNLSCDGAVICSWHDYFRQCPLFHAWQAASSRHPLPLCTTKPTLRCHHWHACMW